MTNCPNCGAPVVADQCEYCGTVFRDRRKDLIDNTVTLQMHITGAELLQKCVESMIITPNEARRRMGFDPI